ncbi:proline-rich protein 22-like [Grus japonensis]|uniref:Proline-rich protein 22-like n=1 Tax=Grus japonensis TaxID=30415 RepID=A0ABC9Y8S7_GRUJA
MAPPPLWLPPRGPRGPPAPRLPQTFLLPQTFYPQGAANLCPLPRQQQPFPAAWPPSLHVAPQGPQALPPPGLQRAPCGCFFDPRVFHIEWTVTSLPPPASSTLSRGTASLPALPTSIPGYRHIEGQPAQTNICGTATPAGAHPDTNIPPGSYDSPSQALEDLPGDLEVSDEELLQEALSLLGCSLDGVEASHEDAGSSPMHGDRGGTGAEGNTVALASPVLPTSSAAYQHVEEQPAQLPIYGTATTAEAHLGSNTPLGSNDPSCPSAASQNQVLGDLAGDLTVSEEVPLEEALRLFGCSLDTVGVSQDAFSSSSPVPGELGGTGTATPHCDFASLSLPEELLTPDYSIPETTDTILSLGEFYTMGMEPQEPWGAAGMALPPSQAAACEKRGKKRGQSALPKPASKRRALAGSTGVAGGGSAANLCPLPRQQQPFPAAWPPSLHVAPQGPQALPPPGLQRAPCGCFFDPRVFHIEWTVTSLPPPASSTLSRGTASLPGAALWGGPRGCRTLPAWAAPLTPQGQPPHIAPQNYQGRAEAPDPPPALPTSIPGYRHIEGQPAQTNICGTATPAGAHPDTNIPPGSYDSPSQALEDLPGDLEVSDEELLQEALSLLGCSLDGVEASHEDAGSSPMHGDRGGTGAEGNTVALASPVLPTSSAAYQHVEEQPAQLPIYGTATTAEAHLGSNTPLGSNDPSCPSAASQNQVLGDLAGDLTVSEEVPLEEALRLFGCSLDTVGVSQDAFSSSSPVPGELGGTGTATPHCDFASLSLPEELLTPDYSIPETTDTILSLGEFYTMGMEPQEPWGAAGMALPPSQAAACEKRGKKRGQSALPKPASKRRALAGSTGVAGGGKPMPAGSKTDPPLAKAEPISASVIT